MGVGAALRAADGAWQSRPGQSAAPGQCSEKVDYLPTAASLFGAGEAPKVRVA